VTEKRADVRIERDGSDLPAGRESLVNGFPGGVERDHRRHGVVNQTSTPRQSTPTSQGKSKTPPARSHNPPAVALPVMTGAHAIARNPTIQTASRTRSPVLTILTPDRVVGTPR